MNLIKFCLFIVLLIWVISDKIGFFEAILLVIGSVILTVTLFFGPMLLYPIHDDDQGEK